MGGSGEAPGPARLPGGAPAELRRFVACATDRVELDLGELSWIPKPEEVPDALTPSVSVLDGWTPGRATIRIGYGPFISIDLPATIVDGQLRVDTSNLGFGIDDEVTKWVDAFNATLRNHGKQLDAFDVRDGKVAVTKRPAAPAAPPAAAAAAPLAERSTPASDDSGTKKTGCLAWVLGGIVALAAAVGITLAATGGDDEPAPAAGDTTTTSSTTLAPSAPTTTLAAVPTTTLGDVGAAPVEPVEQQVCGDFPDGTPSADHSDPGGRAEQLVIFSDSLERIGHAGCAPAAGYRFCAPGILPCSAGRINSYADVGDPGIDHQRSVADAVTGDEGRSKAEHPVYIRTFQELISDAFVRLTANCGGEVLTGEASLVPNGITIVEQPLQQFGSCQIDRLEVLARDAVDQGDVDFFDPDSVARAAAQVRGRTFDVGPDQPDPVPPAPDLNVTNPDIDIPAGWDRNALTVGNTFSLEPAGDGCFWFFDPDNTEVLVKVLDGCSTNNHYWVFYASTTNVEVELTVSDTPIGTAGHFVNPLGVSGPSESVLQQFGTSTSGPYFDNTIYPCGYGHVAYVACPDNDAQMAAAGFVTVTAAMLDTIPIEGDGTERRHSVDFGPAGGPRYDLTQTADGWTVSSSTGETRARALFRDNAVALVAPQDELPAGALAYVWSTTVDGDTAAQPVLPVDGIIQSPSFGEPDNGSGDGDGDGDGDAAIETVEEFYAQLGPSIAAGDLGFALERLHPLVFDAYPTQCPASLASFADPDFGVDVIETLAPEPWVWELPDGRTYDVPDAIAVDVIVSGRGQAGEPTVAHVALVDGTYRWFTFCTADG